MAVNETKTGGFNRNLHLSWLDATAALCAETASMPELRQRLDPIIGQDISGVEGRRKTIDALVSIWARTADLQPRLHAEAVALYQAHSVLAGRLWLHYGLTLIYYPLFRQATAAIGQLSRLEDTVAPAEVKRRVVAQRGALGAVEKSVERVFTSLHDWGILTRQGRGATYIPLRQTIAAEDLDMENWMLGCALYAHPSEELPFADLLRLPELFPFRFTITVDDLRRDPRFGIQRQGSGWDMVRTV